MALPTDYMERVYAGVLGKIIGVYLGRPFEGWHYEPIMEHLGEINYYVHEQFGAPLVVPDDDISGTFTFLRALPDNGNSLNNSRADWQDLAELPDRGAHRPVVGRPRQLNRAYGLSAPEERHPGADERLDRDERQGRGRADRCADLH